MIKRFYIMDASVKISSKWHPMRGPAEIDMAELNHTIMAAGFLPKGFRFRSYRDGAELIADVLKTPAQHRHCCEVIYGESESKVHFDIEWDRSCRDKEGLTWPSKDDFLSDVMGYIETFLMKHYGVAVTWSEVYVLDSSNPDKLSFHMTLPWKFTDLAQRQDFGRRLKIGKGMAGTGDIESLDGCPDVVIYTKNRCIRMPLNRKPRVGKFALEALHRCGDVAFAETADESDVMWRNMLLTGLEKIPALPDAIDDADLEGVRRMLAGKGPARGDGPPRKKARCVVEVNDRVIGHAATTIEIIAMFRKTDSSSTLSHYISQDALYFRTVGHRRCPMGCPHSSNSFKIVIVDRVVNVVCARTTERCQGILQPIGRLPPTWAIAAEEYISSRPDSRPCARPLTFKDHQCIVERTDMGGGKTYQAIALILREHMPGVFMKEYAGGRVEIVAHRVSLREYLYGLLKDHDFELYSLIEDWDNVKKLIICIDSLWKVPPTINFNLVWIDEIHEMIGSLCTLKVKAPG